MKKIRRKKVIRTMMVVILFEIVLGVTFCCLIIDKGNLKHKTSKIVTSIPSNASVKKEAKKTIQSKETQAPQQTENPVIYKYEEKSTYVQGKLLSKHTIKNPNSSGNRNVNMKVAGEIINGKDNKGYILEPNKTFSWLKVVGNTTEEKGFKPATVIKNRQYVQDFGGGVCQVSSTINSAVIKAGLNTQAQKHSLSSSYIGPNDYEATVAYSSGKDLLFKNTFKYPIKIKVSTNCGSVTVKVYKMIKKTTVVKTPIQK